MVLCLFSFRAGSIFYPLMLLILLILLNLLFLLYLLIFEDLLSGLLSRRLVLVSLLSFFLSLSLLASDSYPASGFFGLFECSYFKLLCFEAERMFFLLTLLFTSLSVL